MNLDNCEPNVFLFICSIKMFLAASIFSGLEVSYSIYGYSLEFVSLLESIFLRKDNNSFIMIDIVLLVNECLIH